MTNAVPTGWKVRRLGEVCRVVGRIGFRGYTVNDIVGPGEGAISISPSNIRNGRTTFNKCTYISWEKWEESPEIKISDGDVLLVKTGSTTGKTAIVRDLPQAATLNPQVVVLRNRSINASFLGYVASGREFQQQIVSAVVGGALPTLSQRQVENFTFLCPSDPQEQAAIANALTSVDQLTSGLERQLTKKMMIKQGMIQELLTGRTRLPGFSEPWSTSTIAELATVDPETLPASTHPKTRIDYISLEDVSRGELLGSSELGFARAPSRARRIVKNGDVLFGTVRPNLQSHLLYRGGLRNPIASTGFAVVRARANADPGYLFNLLMSDQAKLQIDRIIAGSNYPAVSSGDVRRLVFDTPHIDEQRAISAALADSDREIGRLHSRLTKARAIKTGMMQQLLTGRTRLPMEVAS